MANPRHWRRIAASLAASLLLLPVASLAGVEAGRKLNAKVGGRVLNLSTDLLVTSGADGLRLSGAVKKRDKSLAIVCPALNVRSATLPATADCGGSFTGVVKKRTGTWSADGGITLKVKSLRGGIAKGSFGGTLSDPSGSGLPPVAVKKGKFALRVEDAAPQVRCPARADENNPKHIQYGDRIGVPELVGDETWTSDNTYFIFGGFDIASHSLTIQAGTTVCLSTRSSGVAQEGRLKLSNFEGFGDDAILGSLRILGTPSAHVTFAPLDGSEANGGGLEFFNYTTVDVQYLDLVRAGHDRAAVIVAQQGQAAVRFDHLRITDAKRRALSVLNGDGFAPGTVITVEGATDAGEPGLEIVEVGGPAANTLTPDALVIDSAVPVDRRAILLTARTMEHGLTLRNLGAPYRLREDLSMVSAIGGSEVPLLTIEPGVRIEAIDTGIFVGGFGTYDSAGGDLVAVGTADAPIVLTSGRASPAAGDWIGVQFGRTTYDPTKSRLEHVVVEYAGGGEGMYHCRPDQRISAGIQIERSSEDVTYHSPSITNTIVRNSAGDGIAAECAPLHCGDTDYTSGFGNSFSSLAGVPQEPLGCQ